MRNGQSAAVSALCLPAHSLALCLGDHSQDVILQCLLPRSKKLLHLEDLCSSLATAAWLPFLGTCFLMMCQRLATELNLTQFCWLVLFFMGDRCRR